MATQTQNFPFRTPPPSNSTQILLRAKPIVGTLNMTRVEVDNALAAGTPPSGQLVQGGVGVVNLNPDDFAAFLSSCGSPTKNAVDIKYDDGTFAVLDFEGFGTAVRARRRKPPSRGKRRLPGKHRGGPDAPAKRRKKAARKPTPRKAREKAASGRGKGRH